MQVFIIFEIIGKLHFDIGKHQKIDFRFILPVGE